MPDTGLLSLLLRPVLTVSLLLSLQEFLAALVPQLFAAVTLILPFCPVVPVVTVIEVVPAPPVIVQPVGTVHV